MTNVRSRGQGDIEADLRRRGLFSSGVAVVTAIVVATLALVAIPAVLLPIGANGDGQTFLGMAVVVAVVGAVAVAVILSYRPRRRYTAQSWQRRR